MPEAARAGGRAPGRQAQQRPELRVGYLKERHMQGVTLDTIGGGALSELFEAELARVLANIADPNTDQASKRVITIQVAFKPNRDRDSADVDLKCQSKLAGIQTVSSVVYMGRKEGKLIAVESDPRQSRLFDDERPLATKVASFGRVGE